MSAAVIHQKLGPIPVHGVMGEVSVPQPQTTVAKPYTQEDFNRQNQIFRTKAAVINSLNVCNLWFSEVVYKKGDSHKVQCGAYLNHPLREGRESAIWDTHFAIRLLDTYLLDPNMPVERNAKLIYAKIMSFLTESDSVDQECRAEARRRIINIALVFFAKQTLVIADELVSSGKEKDKRSAALSIFRNEPGSFVDALACEMVRKHVAFEESWVF